MISHLKYRTVREILFIGYYRNKRQGNLSSDLGLFIVSLFPAISYGDRWDVFFFGLWHIWFEFCLKIVYNKVGVYNYGGGVFNLFREGRTRLFEPIN